MYLTVKGSAFTCPECASKVLETCVTHVQCVFTAPAMALHDGVGHTVVLVGDARWVVRCGSSRRLVPVRLQAGVDKVLRDAAELPPAAPVHAPVSAPARKMPAR